MCVDVCTCVHVHVFPAGHGTTGTLKVPTKVQNIEPVRQVDCGAAHTMCLSMDSVRVWSFGAGDSGKLGHGDTNRQLLPKVCEWSVHAYRFYGGNAFVLWCTPLIYM